MADELARTHNQAQGKDTTTNFAVTLPIDNATGALKVALASGGTPTLNSLTIAETLGAELVVNGSFATDTDWTKGAGWTIASGVATHGAGTGTLTPTVALVPTVGTLYKLVYTVTNWTVAGMTVTFGGVVGQANTAPSANGTYTMYIRATTTGDLIFTPLTGLRCDIDNVSIKAVTTGITSPEEILLANTTAATDGIQEQSPVLHFQGQGWKTNATAASQSVDWKMNLVPVQGTTNPTATFDMSYSINGAAYTSGFSLGTTSALSIVTSDLGLIRQAASRLQISDGGANLAFTRQAGILMAAGSGDPGVDGNYKCAIAYYGQDNTVVSGWAYKWTSSSTVVSASADTCLSRIAPGIVGIGTGAAGSFAGTLQSTSQIIAGPNGSQWIQGYATELLTLSTVGTTTDTSANLLPANSIIKSVVARVTTTITTATDWKLGDATTPGRFTAADATMTANETQVGLVHIDQTGAAGPRQTTAAKVRVTTTGTPGAGVIRITVFYEQFVAPTS